MSSHIDQDYKTILERFDDLFSRSPDFDKNHINPAYRIGRADSECLYGTRYLCTSVSAQDEDGLKLANSSNVRITPTYQTDENGELTPSTPEHGIVRRPLIVLRTLPSKRPKQTDEYVLLLNGGNFVTDLADRQKARIPYLPSGSCGTRLTDPFGETNSSLPMFNNFADAYEMLLEGRGIVYALAGLVKPHLVQ